MLKASGKLGLYLAGSLLLAFIASEFVGGYHQTVLALMGINCLLAISLNLVNGLTGQFSMGHAGFMAVGAYAASAISAVALPALSQTYPWINELLIDPWLSQILFLILLFVGGSVSALIGFLVGLPSLRLRGDYLAIVTLGFGEIIRICILNIETVGGARGLGGIPQLSNLYWIFAVLVFSTVFLHRLVFSVPGSQFMAARDDEVATLAMGLSTTKIKVKAFVIASFFAGVAGVLFSHFLAYLNPATFTFNYSFQVITMVVLGGMGSLTGSLASAVLLTGLLELLRDVQDLIGIDLRMVFYSLILIVIMLTRPNGLMGRKELSDLWKARFQRKPV